MLCVTRKIFYLSIVWDCCIIHLFWFTLACSKTFDKTIKIKAKWLTLKLQQLLKSLGGTNEISGQSLFPTTLSGAQVWVIVPCPQIACNLFFSGNGIACFMCLMHRLSRLKDDWMIIMSLVLTFITLITFYTYIPCWTYIETHLVSTARSLTSVGQTAVQRILIVCPMETSLAWWYWSPLNATQCMRGSSCSSPLNWLPCVEEDLIAFILFLLMM